MQSRPTRILCLTSHNLDGPEYGATLRARNMFRLLSRVGQVRIMLIDAVEAEAGTGKASLGGFELAGILRFQPTRQRTLTDRLRYEFDGRFLNTDWSQACAEDRDRLRALIAQHDLVWLHGLRIANGCGIWRWPNSVLDIDDIPSSFHRTDLAQAAGIVDQLRCYRQVAMWRRREKHLLARFDAVCVCSEKDREKLGNPDRVFVVPNGFAVPKRAPLRCPSMPPRVGFVGPFQYRPNREGVRWFVERVWPRILQAMPRARLRLVGKGTEAGIGPAHPSIDGLGWIADMEGEMATWSLAIVPIFVGGGTRIKIAEAFSRKCPVVSTTLGAYGYGVVDGREMLVADTVEDFAAKCLQILSQPSLGPELADKGWQRFLASWTWDSFGDRVASAAETVLKNSSKASSPEAASVA